MLVKLGIISIALQTGLALVNRDSPYILSINSKMEADNPILMQNHTLDSLNKFFFTINNKNDDSYKLSDIEKYITINVT